MPLHPCSAALRSGEIALADHIALLCDRIEQADTHIRALLPEQERRARLLAEAEALERRYPDVDHRPPLYGILVGAKDIFRVEGFPTGCGTALPSELFAGSEALCVTRLREAGAIILAKTVTTEFAMYEPGPTRNPHHRDHTPGGSSSGSAAAVAAGLTPLALGSQTVGSVIRPAAYCGVVGFKPSFDRIPTQGILYCSRSLDQIGMFTQDAAGMALAASVLLDDWQAEAREAASMPALGVPEGAYLEQADADGLRAFAGQLAHLERAGCAVRRVAVFDEIEEIATKHLALAYAEFAQEHKAWFDQYGALYRPGTTQLIERGRAVTREEREAGQRGGLELRERLHTLMDEHGIDLWASPPAPGPAPRGLASTGDPKMNLPWTHAGLPTVTIPAGRTENGLPFGLQLSARFMEDERLLAWTERLEATLGAL